MGDQGEGPAGFARARHAAFLELMSSELPDGYATQEVNHLTLAYFAVAGLSLLRELDRVLTRIKLPNGFCRFKYTLRQTST
uniref:Prenyltransferase alpha-alpha toroid domain-containing protein n=1 Tax=Aegilops tauschii subsp. strangulata TaxID=200361 RepID=A0A453DZ83_AEGTS